MVVAHTNFIDGKHQTIPHTEGRYVHSKYEDDDADYRVNNEVRDR